MCRKKTTPIVRADCATGWALFLIAVNTQAQTLSKEYIRLGGRVVAIEAPVSAFTVTPDPPPTVPAPGNQLTFNSNLPANWTVTPPTAGAFSPASGTNVTLTVANPLPNGLLSLTVTATQQGGSSSRNIVVPLMAPIVISGAATLSPGGQSQYSANIPVTWEISPGNLGTVSPASTAANALTTVTVSSNPPGSPSGFSLIARDARAATDPRFQTNLGSQFIGIQYGGPPSALGGFSVSYYNNGSAAAGWTFGFTDPGGPQNIAWMAVHFSGTSSQSIPFSCALYVFPLYNGYSYLLDDSGSGAVAGYIGQDEPLRNSQCLIEMKGLRYYTQGSTRYLEVPAYFNPSFLGARDIYLSVANNQNQVQAGNWLKVGYSWNMYYNSFTSSLAIHPTQGTMLSQTFRTSAINNLSGSDIPLMSMYAKDALNNSCQVVMYPGYNWAYVLTNNPYLYDGNNLTATSYVMNTSRCSVAMSSLKFKTYVPLSPTAPYAFFDAQIQANPPIRGTTQSMFGLMYFTINGNWYADTDRYVGFWTIPNSPL